METARRIIGIRHRRKKTAEGEARPTTVAIKVGDNIVCHDLETETDEKDFLLSRLPIAWEAVADQDVVWFDAQKAPNGLRPHQCKWKKVKRDQVALVKANHMRQTVDKKGLPVIEQLMKVPTKFDGLQQGDIVGMVLGGSGDRFASALSRHGEEVQARVYRIPPFSLQKERGEKSKDDDHLTLAQSLDTNPELFYHLGPKDRGTIRVKEALSIRQDALKARIGCEQRIFQALVGKIFLSEEGKYPEGLIEDQYDAIKASDVILQGLIAEEERRDKELKAAVQQLEVWQQLFDPIEGCGERIAAGLIASIGDIRRFAVPAGLKYKVTKTKRKVKAFCGVGPRGGLFQRRRAGQLANWNPLARQALYLLVDQFNRRPGTLWGGKLLVAKENYRKKYPEPVEVEVNGKENGNGAKKTVKKYTNGHIHKMALWHTATKFIEWTTREWLKLEKVYEN